MSDQALLDWLSDVARKHGFDGAEGGAGGSGATALAEPVDEHSDLEREYERLGGDAELLKALAAEDKLFRTELEKKRAEALDWQKDRRRELQGQKDHLAHLVEIATGGKYQAFIDREKALLGPIEARARELGDKLQTEPGKELLLLIGKHRERIESLVSSTEETRAWLGKVRPMQELIDLRLKDVEHTYEAVEQRIRDTRTELDNALELKAMSLQEKVERLRGGSAKARAEAQDKLEKELRKVFGDSVAEDKAVYPMYDAPWGESDLDALDWKPIETKLAELGSSSLEGLRKEDPKLARLERKYEKAGGDEALFEKRYREWKEEVQGFSNRRQSFATIHASVEEDLQKRLVDAQMRVQETEKELTGLRAKLARAKARMEELTSRAGAGDLLSREESAELELLSRAQKRLEKDVPNLERLLPIHRKSKENAEALLEKARQRHELEADDDSLAPPPEPRSQDLHDLPLRARYEELVAKG